MSEQRAVSKDGTAIAFDRIGEGPPVLLVDGAIAYRGFGPSRPLAKALATRFTVFTYDRRGRGESGDTAPYAVRREIEDIEALARQAGGEIFVWGISSGAVLSLEAALQIPGIRKLALYEPPFIVDSSRPSTEGDWASIRQAIAANRPSDAAKVFLKSIGMPGFAIAVARWTPIWAKLKASAATLPHDAALVEEHQRGKPLKGSRWSPITIPTLVMDGGKSPAWMRNGTQALAKALPNAQYRTLPGQTHDVKAKAIAPALIDFFSG